MIDKYTSMEELKEDAERIKTYVSAEEYELILYVCGLLENQGICEEIDIQGQQIKIDKYLVPMIKDLNQRNIKTIACCSGLEEEHQRAKFKPESGYICIEYNKRLLEKLTSLISNANIKIMESTCYFKPCISITICRTNDMELKEIWSSIWKILRQQQMD